MQQVRLLASSGIPDDALVSIRAGATRRQAAVSARKPLRFPEKDLAEGELKVDLLRKIGQGSVCLKPSKQCTQYRLVLGEGADMACELVVGEGGALDQFVAGLGADWAQRHGEQEVPYPVKPYMSARDSQEYLESIGVLQFVQRVLQQVVKERPRKPYEFIAKQFLRGFDPPAQVEGATQTEVDLNSVAGGECLHIDGPHAGFQSKEEPPSVAQGVATATADAVAQTEVVWTASRSQSKSSPSPLPQPQVPTGVVSVTEADTNFTGFGFREFASGDVYEGEFLDGKRHGRGKCQYSLGDIYDGDWCQDVMRGRGSMQYQEGMYYEGQWCNGKHHGNGRYVWVKEHEEYEGEFKEDELFGWGRYIYANDEVYEGEFVNGVKHGKGRHVLADGRIAFEGAYTNGAPDASGWLLPEAVDVGGGMPTSTAAIGPPEAALDCTSEVEARDAAAAPRADIAAAPRADLAEEAPPAVADVDGGGGHSVVGQSSVVAGDVGDDDETSSIGSAGI